MDRREGSCRLGRGGFTLAELIVVMALMALLAGIAVPTYLGYIRRAKKQQDILDARQMGIAVAAMMTEQDIRLDQVAENEVYMSIFWRKVGDPEHPLYGACPSRWDPEGTILERSVDEDYRLTDLVYQAPGGFRERWHISEEGGLLQMEVTREGE